jgi:maltose O-acetyltransferase
MLSWLFSVIGRTRYLRFLVDWTFLYARLLPEPLWGRVRASFWRGQMHFVGRNSYISYNVTIHGPRGISIGSNTRITNNCILNGRGSLDIGDDVLIGFQSIVLTSAHRFRDPATPIRLQGSDLRPVKIGNDVWIGARVVIQPGVTIGNGAVVGSGAVVTRDVPPLTVVAGVPARVIGNRNEGIGPGPTQGSP